MSSASSTPSIRVYESHRYSLPHHHRPDHPSPAVAMAIPSARTHAPPPLPPPRHIEALRSGQDAGWHWGNMINKDNGNHHLSLARESSLYRSELHKPREPSPDRMPSDSDEDHGGKSLPSLTNARMNLSKLADVLLDMVHIY
ncbi:hypothetical protein GQ44DRAFT_479904 [Phaeosphaeriaceae sp. PMI808]|nr:hypothetical protein GQ44DRAFT_479904 [Phaeosphaeriaceae sp. PMI808]